MCARAILMFLLVSCAWAADVAAPKLWIVPLGTRIPIQLRQPISTKTARVGDPVYAQTTYPIAVQGDIMIPAGTWVQGVVDHIKRAGRIKGTAQLEFHLDTFLYPNGYAVSIAAAIDQVPGNQSTRLKESALIEQRSEKSHDLERVGGTASLAATIGIIVGSATNTTRGFGVGALSGIAAGTIIALLARGSDVQFESGTPVEIALTHAMAIEVDQVHRAPR